MIFSYRLTLTDEPMRLPSVKPKYSQVRLSTPSTNATPVYISGSPVDSESDTLRFAIAAGTKFPFKVSDLSQIWVTGTADDVLDVLCEQKTPKTEVKKIQGGENEPSQDK